MFDPQELHGVVIITGYYGVGKTNLALNLAHDAASAGREVCVIDFDIVNPYFRASDYRSELQEAGIRVIAPLYAGTSLDSPGLSPLIEPAIEDAHAHPEALLLIDAGGDDAGATALGRYSRLIAQDDYQMYYVVNAFRNLTQTPEDAAAVLPAIEEAGHLHATGIVNNSHLKQETTPDVVQKAGVFGAEVARICGLPLVARCIPKAWLNQPCAEILADDSYGSRYPVSVYVTTPWE